MRENESKQNHVSWPNHRYIFFQYKETVGDCITYQCHIYNVFFVLKSASEQFKTGCSLVYSLLQKKNLCFYFFCQFSEKHAFPTHTHHICLSQMFFSRIFCVSLYAIYKLFTIYFLFYSFHPYILAHMLHQSIFLSNSLS